MTQSNTNAKEGYQERDDARLRPNKKPTLRKKKFS